MSSEEREFRDLIGRVRGGDEAAATQLVRGYEPVVRRVVRLRDPCSALTPGSAALDNRVPAHPFASPT